MEVKVSPSESHKVVFSPAIHPLSSIKKVGIIGMGEVVLKRVWPALCSNSYPLEAIFICSLEPTSALEGLPHTYHPVEPGSLLPLNKASLPVRAIT